MGLEKSPILKCDNLFKINIILTLFILLCFTSNVTSKIQESKGDGEVWKRNGDKSVDLCENFYDFACGNYEADSGKSKSDYLNLSDDNFESNSTAVQKMKQFIETRSNFKEKLTKTSVSQLLNEIKLIGDCPLFDSNWSSKNFNLTSTLLKINELTGQPNLFDFTVYSKSRKDASLLIMPINVSKTKCEKCLKPDGSLKEDIKTALFNVFHAQLNFLMVKSGTKSGVKNGIKNGVPIHIDTNNLFGEIKKLVEIDFGVNSKLNKAGYYDQGEKEFNKYGHIIDAKNKNYERIQFNELDNLLPIIGGSRYFLNNAKISPDVHSYLTKNPFVYISNRKLLIELNDYYTNLNKETLANYLCVNYIGSQLKYFGFDIKKYVDENSLEMSGRSVKDNVFMDNNELINTYFPLVADHLFVNKYVDEKSIEVVREMVNQVKWGAEQIFTRTAWLDERSRANVLLKLRSIKGFVGANNISNTHQKLDQYYQDWTILKNDTYREMNLKLILFGRQKVLQEILEPEKGMQQISGWAPVSNAFYHPHLNIIFILGGRMFPPYFDINMPKSVQFGTIGFTIGHEIFHGFDTTSIHRDAFGARNDVLKNKTMAKYYNRTKCLVDQFSELEDTLSEKHLNIEFRRKPYINGTKTVNENLADLMGIQAAFLAYKNFVETYEFVPGFEDYYSDQLFFIGYANKWCGKKESSVHIPYLFDKSVHSPNKNRVNEVLKNMPEFAKAFKCRVGSGMNPRKKCRIF